MALWLHYALRAMPFFTTGYAAYYMVFVMFCNSSVRRTISCLRSMTSLSWSSSIFSLMATVEEKLIVVVVVEDVVGDVVVATTLTLSSVEDGKENEEPTMGPFPIKRSGAILKVWVE